MKRAIVFIIIIMAAISSWYYTALADNVTVNVTVNPKKILTLSTNTVNFGSIDPEVETVVQPAVTANVESNTTWTLNLTKSDDLLPSSADAGNFQYDDDSTGSYSGTYANFSVTGADISSGNATSSTDTNVRYRLNVPFTVDPAAYSAVHVYTLN